MADRGFIDKFRNKTPENSEDARIIESTNHIWKYLQESRRRREYDWYVNDMFYNNNQYMKYNVAARRVQSIPIERQLDRITINKVYQQVRGIVNFLNAEHPTIGVRPGNQSDDAYLRAKKEKDLADYWYRKLELNKKGKKTSLDAAKYGIGWWKILYDIDALAPTRPFVLPNGEKRDFQFGEVLVDRCDPYEVYWDPMAQDKEDMRYMIHAPVRTISELQNNKLYKNGDRIQSDNRLAASHLKQAEIRLNIAAGSALGPGQPNGMDTVLTLEIYQKIFSSVSNRWEVYVTTRTDSGILMRHEKFPVDEFPFEFFTTDVVGMLMDSKGVIHNIREPNRALNEIVSQIHETSRIMGKLNWRMPRGSNVNVITDETGQFIEYDPVPGGAPEQVQPAGLPNYIMSLPAMLGNFIEDIGGMHASFNGRAPFAQASGDLVDKLSEGDQNSLTTMRDNYDDFMVRAYKLMFKTAKVNYKETRQFPTGSLNELGESRWQELKPSEIDTSDDVVVSTGTQMPYSIADKQQMYINLWKEKAIQDPQTLFRLLEMPDIDAAMGDDEADVERQLDEIRTVRSGGELGDPVIAENHNVHVATLDKFIRGNEWGKLNPVAKQKLLDHRTKHINFVIQLAKISASMQVEPIKRSETIMLRMNKMADTTPSERTQLLNNFGINSDSAEVQLRGGLYIQDPEQATLQAQNEDIEMMSMRGVQTSYGDNHQVHLQIHAEALAAVAANVKAQDAGTLPDKVQPVSRVTLELMQHHVKEHIQDMMATTTAPGLVPNDDMMIPDTPTVNAPERPENMPEQNTAPVPRSVNEKSGRKETPESKMSPRTPPTPPVETLQPEPANPVSKSADGKKKAKAKAKAKVTKKA